MERTAAVILLCGAVLIVVGTFGGLIAGIFRDRRDRRARRERVERDHAAIPAAAKVLAADPASRLNQADWTNVLHELQRAGFDLNESQAVIRAFGPGLSRIRPTRPAFPPNRVLRDGETPCAICGSGRSSHRMGERDHVFKSK